jgi:putative transposase
VTCADAPEASDRRAPAPLAVPQAVDRRWPLHFLAGQVTNSRGFWILSVVDDFTREWLALVRQRVMRTATVGGNTRSRRGFAGSSKSPICRRGTTLGNREVGDLLHRPA